MSFHHELNLQQHMLVHL